MTSHEIRKQFLDFFAGKAHRIVPSAPIVVQNDPTLMFTNAGMNQFKDLFLGNKPVQYPRIADTQKCLRVSGKHNDLEEVGVDTYHHTMFEMLGNWSFGDYFKKEAIAWSWELLTGKFGLDPNRLYVTVFEGDAGEGLAYDTEAETAWKAHIAPERILKGNKKDNFWEMGDTGPCGPCSEIHYDMRSDAERSAKDGSLFVNASDPQVIEIWNLVFMQFNRKADGSLEELPAKHVDTGMGFERLVRAMQGKTSNYDTDIFTPLIRKTEVISGYRYGSDDKKDIAVRVICDHIRAVSFCIADGQLPSNTGAGYVIRRILRRAIRYGFSFLGLRDPFFHALVTVLAEENKDVFPELAAQKDLVARVILEEETTFLRTLENGIRRLQEIMQHEKKEIPGTVAFELYDTYGFPLDLTHLIAREAGLGVDEKGFSEEMEKQKTRSRHATELETGDWQMVNDIRETHFCGYTELETEARIVKMRTVSAKKEKHFQIVLDNTPFYAESGGQIGDTGTLRIGDQLIHVTDTKKENDLIIHFTDVLPVKTDGTVLASVDAARRTAITYNHTATHLVHAALRTILGPHVQQKGSYVGPDRLRFDFSHFAKVTDTELAQIEELVNKKIRENIPVITKVMPIEEAKEIGAMMLFGEKYGDMVRVVIADPEYSKEFCGGTHVGHTGEIGYCRILSETAVAAGIRRIEAITGEAVFRYIQDQSNIIHSISELLRSKTDLAEKVQHVLEANSALQKEVEQFKLGQLDQIKNSLLQQKESVGDVLVIRAIVPLDSAELVKKLAYALRNEQENLFCVLGAEIGGKANLTVIISDALVAAKNLDAGKIVRELGKEIDGGGGGQAFFASAGGKNPGGLKKAIERSLEYLA